MKIKDLPEAGARTMIVVFEMGDEIVGGLLELAAQKQIRGAHFSGIGALREAVIANWDPKSKEYQPIRVNEQVELVSLIGNIAIADEGPKVHAHVALARRDGTVIGGHLLKGYVHPTLEVIIRAGRFQLRRETDKLTGLPLLNL